MSDNHSSQKTGDESDGSSKRDEDRIAWSFEVGDIVTNGLGDDFEITQRLIDSDTGERYYRESHVSNNATMFGKAEDIEERHELANEKEDGPSTTGTEDESDE